MSLRTELENIYEDADIRHIIGRREAIILGLFAIVIVATVLVMIFHNHNTVIGMGSYDPNFEWAIPNGSPEVGVQPNGSVGFINEFGRISSV